MTTLPVTTLPATGFHYGVPFTDYQAWPAVNFSTLKHIRRSPAHCHHAMKHPKAPTPAMIFGSAVHISTLEPARFAEEFYIAGKIDRRTKEGKADYEAMLKEAEGKHMLSEDDAETVRQMCAAIRSSTAAARWLDQPGQCEVSALWKDEATGVFCKARFDKLVPQPAVIVELKTTKDASGYGFGKEVANYLYHVQAAWYRWGHQVITGRSANHAMICVERCEDYDPALFLPATHILDDAALQTGALLFRKWLELYAECDMTGRWPGYADKFETLSLPNWAQHED